MGLHSNYQASLFDEFEKLNKKLDKANQTIATLSMNNQLLLEEVKKLNKTIKEKDKKI